MNAQPKAIRTNALSTAFAMKRARGLAKNAQPKLIRTREITATIRYPKDGKTFRAFAKGASSALKIGPCRTYGEPDGAYLVAGVDSGSGTRGRTTIILNRAEAIKSVKKLINIFGLNRNEL